MTAQCQASTKHQKETAEVQAEVHPPESSLLLEAFQALLHPRHGQFDASHKRVDDFHLRHCFHQLHLPCAAQRILCQELHCLCQLRMQSERSFRTACHAMIVLRFMKRSSWFQADTDVRQLSWMQHHLQDIHKQMNAIRLDPIRLLPLNCKATQAISATHETKSHSLTCWICTSSKHCCKTPDMHHMTWSWLQSFARSHTTTASKQASKQDLEGMHSRTP